MTASAEFHRRLEIARRLARLNSGRTEFTHEEKLQLIVATTVFTTSELQRMLEDAQAQADASRVPLPSHSDASAA